MSIRVRGPPTISTPSTTDDTTVCRTKGLELVLTIKLKRAFEPSEIGDQECGICGCRFEGESVLAHILEVDLGQACPACLDHMSKRNPGKFPSIEDLEDAIQRYPEPVYASLEEVERLEQADDPSVHKAYAASWITRAAS